MRCARISGRNMPLVLENRPIPVLPNEGVLVKTLFGGICRSDLHYIIDQSDMGNGVVFRHSDVIGTFDQIYLYEGPIKTLKYYTRNESVITLIKHLCF